MTSLTFHCEVVTPMFLGGANPAISEFHTTYAKTALYFKWLVLDRDLLIKEKDVTLALFDILGRIPRKVEYVQKSLTKMKDQT